LSRSRPLSLVQINNNDVMGARFNGYAIRDALRTEDIHSTHLVWNRSVDDPMVQSLTPFPGSRAFQRMAARIGKRASLQSMLEVQSFLVAAQGAFRRADVVHYHLIYEDFFSLHALPMLTALKPSIWTWHDPWPMTGHCSHPLDCDGWLKGCPTCPHLDWLFPLNEDKAAVNFRFKRNVLKRSKLDVVVASSWMMDMARRSPIAGHLRLHQIPFGLDIDLYRPRVKETARQRFGIEEGRTVIALRADANPYKGLSYFLEALDRIGEDYPLCILALQGTELFDKYLGRHQIVETGWVNDEDLLVDAMSAADIFSMPSIADSFGMMSVEAMACGAVPIVFEGTALPATVFAPEAGIAVPARDSSALAQAFRQLIDNPAERRQRAERGRALVEEHYDSRLHVQRLAGLYREVAGRGAQGRA
jgi:glycosyltransferase involved in cell wall biosynthesis